MGIQYARKIGPLAHFLPASGCKIGASRPDSHAVPHPHARDRMADEPNETPGLTREEVLTLAREEITRAAGDSAAPNLDAVAQKLADAKLKLADARGEVAALQTRVPGEGAVVLTGDEATAYTQLKAREGYDAAPLAKAAADLDTAKTALQEVATLKATAEHERAVTALGYKPEPFAKYLSTERLRMKEVDGKPVPHAVTTDADGNEVLTPAEAYISEKYPEALPLLTGNAAPEARKGGAALPQRAASGGGQTALPTSEDIAAEMDRSGDYTM